MAAKKSPQAWAAIRSAFIESSVEPTIAELAMAHGVGKVSIRQRLRAENWDQKRAEYQRVAARLQSSKDVAKHLQARQASNAVYVQLAQVMRHEYAQAFQASRQAGEVMSASTARKWISTLKDSLSIESAACGDVPEVVLRVQQEVATIAEIEARITGGKLTDAEMIAALEKLTAVDVLKAMGFVRPSEREAAPVETTAGDLEP